MVQETQQVFSIAPDCRTLVILVFVNPEYIDVIAGSLRAPIGANIFAFSNLPIGEQAGTMDRGIGGEYQFFEFVVFNPL